MRSVQTVASHSIRPTLRLSICEKMTAIMGVCPHCGVLLKLHLVPMYYFEPELCSVEEFEKEAYIKLSEEQ